MKNLVVVTLAVFAYFANSNDAFTIDSRIVSGQEAKLGQFPYYAFLNIHKGHGGFACGASLLNEEWLLTAAHCLEGADLLEVVLGESQLEYQQPGAVVIEVESDGFLIHPDYYPESALNDIGSYC